METDDITQVKDLHRQILKKEIILHCLKKCRDSGELESVVEEGLLLNKFSNIGLTLKSDLDESGGEAKKNEIIMSEMASFNAWIEDISKSHGSLNTNKSTAELVKYEEKIKSVSKSLTSLKNSKEEASQLINQAVHEKPNQALLLLEKKASSIAFAERTIFNELKQQDIHEEPATDSWELLNLEKNRLKSELELYKKVHNENYDKILKDYNQVLKERNQMKEFNE